MGRSSLYVALFLSLRYARLIPKGIDLGVKTSAPSCPPTLPLYQGLPIEHAENQGTLPIEVASVVVEIQTVPIAVETLRIQKVYRSPYGTNCFMTLLGRM